MPLMNRIDYIVSALGNVLEDAKQLLKESENPSQVFDLVEWLDDAYQCAKELQDAGANELLGNVTNPTRSASR